MNDNLQDKKTGGTVKSPCSTCHHKDCSHSRIPYKIKHDHPGCYGNQNGSSFVAAKETC